MATTEHSRHFGIGLFKTVFALAFLATLAVFSPFVAKKAIRTPVRELAEKFPLKRWFVELNGGACRAAGRSLCNAVYRMPDGMLLSESKGKGRTETVAARVASFAEWLAKRNIPYIYVQAPAKIDRAGTMLPEPFVNSGNVRADAVLSALASSGVRVIDLRAMLASTPEDVRRHFYLTDHHWNNDAVFKAFHVLAPEIARAAGFATESVADVASSGSWTRKVWPQCFTGTKARRTGYLFGGMDDLIVYRPQFATDMDIEIPSREVRISGDFKKTVMWHSGKIMNGGTDGFGRDAYSLLYIGGTYGVVRQSNRVAPLKLRLMIVGDSFARPLEAFLSTAVSDVIALDQRRFAPGETVARFIESFKPDVVLQVANPSAFGAESLNGLKQNGPALFNYGELK